MYTVDGAFLAQRVSGIQRYTLEILAELDRIIEPGEVELAVPPGAAAPEYQNIRAVPTGSHTGMLWEQLDYPAYLRKNGRLGLCTCNVIPLSGFRGIAVVHDVCYRARPDFYTAPRARLSAAWHRMQYRVIARTCSRIVTVSRFSGHELEKYYGVSPDRVTVIPNAWQHMQRVEADDGVFAKWPQLKQGKYYFSMSNLLKNKNFPWVLRAAQNKPDAVFAIAGGGDLAAAAGKRGLHAPSNVLCLGYVSDGEAKALMANCKAFVFPTLYEGFGIPPLEAIACGAPRVLVSNTPCMREIYGTHADYIDLETNHGNVDDVVHGHDAAGVLERYSWAESARLLRDLLRSADV
ncbi:MAG TPA: glycosyltransferase family 4 protein [Candidatus Gemmiger faecigallinarum]|nr:glycosyltransferase family 4 protein [Candidatus Gemmiger faecigallinarum]